MSWNERNSRSVREPISFCLFPALGAEKRSILHDPRSFLSCSCNLSARLLLFSRPSSLLPSPLFPVSLLSVDDCISNMLLGVHCPRVFSLGIVPLRLAYLVCHVIGLHHCLMVSVVHGHAVTSPLGSFLLLGHDHPKNLSWRTGYRERFFPILSRPPVRSALFTLALELESPSKGILHNCVSLLSFSIYSLYI